MTLRSSTNTSMRAWRRYFPLVSVESLVDLVEEMLQTNHLSDSASTCSSAATAPAVFPEPNLAFLSIILGYIECHITTSDEPTGAPSTPTRKRSLNGARSSRGAKRLSIRLSPTTPVASSSNVDFSQVPLSLVDEEMTQMSTLSLVPSDSAPSPMDATTPSSVTVAPESMKPAFPTLRYEDAEQLYQTFYDMIVHNPKLASMAKGLPDEVTPKKAGHSADRRLVRAVCDVLCAHLSSSARQREHFVHAQSIYSLLKCHQLDSFGLAYATVAACQLLGYTDVHLALSEDHAWVEFGPPDRRETADVSVMPALELSEIPSPTKTSSSAPVLYPPPVRLGHLLHSWLYLNGHPVVCNPLILTVAAAVAAIQPCGLSKSVRPPDHVAPTLAPPASKRRLRKLSCTLSTSSDGYPTRNVETISPELVRLKQTLLWTVCRAGMLNQYPLGLTNLADIEEGYPSTGVRLDEVFCDFQVSPCTPGPDYALTELVEVYGNFQDIAFPPSPSEQPDIPLELLKRAVDINRAFFHNQHVYPYIYLANYLRRRGDLLGALRNWAEAARVIGQYNHSSEDAEIYREFLDVATRVIPEVFRVCAMENRAGISPNPNLLDSPLCLAYLLAFYDHLCLWEEGSVVPVLHVGWVDKLVASLTRFSTRARSQLHLEATRTTDDANADTPKVTTKKRPRLNFRLCSAADGSATPGPVPTRGGEPSPLPAAETSSTVESARAAVIDAVEEVPRAEALRVILPSQTASMSLQSCSTTGSSLLSVFTNTPLLSGGENSTIASFSEMAPRSSQSEVVRSSPRQDLLPGLLDSLEGGEEDLLDVCSLIVDCCTGSKEKVISRLARASQFRLLNPAFLMGDLSAPPFVTSEELDDFLAERQPPESEMETGENQDSEVPARSNSSTAAPMIEVQGLSQTQEPQLQSQMQENQEGRGEEPMANLPHSQNSVVVVSEEVAEEEEGEEEEEEERLGVDVALLLPQHRVSSPESSVCPSLPSISSTPPVFALPITPLGALAPIDGEVDAVANVNQMETAVEGTNGEVVADGHLEVLVAPASEMGSQGDGDRVLETANPVVIEGEEIVQPVSEERSARAEPSKPPGVYLRLHSAKMCRIAGLLNAPGCLKSSAIKLTLTAQSEVDFGRRRRVSTPVPPRWRVTVAAASSSGAGNPAQALK